MNSAQQAWIKGCIEHQSMNLLLERAGVSKESKEGNLKGLNKKQELEVKGSMR